MRAYQFINVFELFHVKKAEIVTYLANLVITSAPVPRVWQPCQVSRSKEEFTKMGPRIDFKLEGKQLPTITEIQSTGRAFSRMVNRNLTLSHFCTLDNLVYNMLTLFSLLRLIHMIEG